MGPFSSASDEEGDEEKKADVEDESETSESESEEASESEVKSTKIFIKFLCSTQLPSLIFL